MKLDSNKRNPIAPRAVEDALRKIRIIDITRKLSIIERKVRHVRSSR